MALPLKGILNELHDITNVINPHVTMSCSASLIQKISEATDRLCHIALNQKFLHKFKKWCKFSSCDKQNRIKWDLPVQAKSTDLETQKTNGTFVLIFHQAILFYSSDYCEMSMNKISVLTYVQVQMLDGHIRTRRPISLELNGSWVLFWKMLSIC
jgi:flagellar biosynthesis component FlhA